MNKKSSTIIRKSLTRYFSSPSKSYQWSPYLSTTSLESITLMRHAESVGNTGEQSPQEIGDHNLTLSSRGEYQATKTGERFGREMFLPANSPRPLIYCSPYKRTRETMDGILEGAKVSRDDVEIFEDIRLREVEFGYGQPHFIPIEQQELMRPTHGYMFFRFHGGEAPSDCFDRCSAFLSTFHRQLCRSQARQALIVSHGLTIRCFIARFFHLTVEQFYAMENPLNCNEIEIVRGGQNASDEFGQLLVRSSSTWGLKGIKLRQEWLDKSHEWRTPKKSNSQTSQPPSKSSTSLKSHAQTQIQPPSQSSFQSSPSPLSSSRAENLSAGLAGGEKISSISVKKEFIDSDKIQ